MDSAKQQLIEKLKTASNVLVTVSRDPSVDQLASCIGLSLLLNKQGKHTAAVFSGEVPSTIEFLKPGETLEKNTDSLRDFIISLDKSKADKLRYKVEDNIVRIFITPYKTSISQADLEFSEGDFNVDVVVALGVKQQEDLEDTITAHGRILHDATVTSLNTSADGGLGSINWNDPQASSLSELVTELAQALGSDLIDNQIATALLTGIVSETNRFSNDKTTPQTMSASAALMAAGANQQLVASNLQKGGQDGTIDVSDSSGQPKSGDDKGTLSIDHNETPRPTTDFKLPEGSKAEADGLPPLEEPAGTGPTSGVSPGAKLVTEPPILGGTLTANSRQNDIEPTSDPLSLPASEPPQLLDHQPATLPTMPPATPTTPLSPAPSGWTPPPALAQPKPDTEEKKTLTDLEKAVDSPHAQEENVDTARSQVDQALRAAATDDSQPDEPVQSLNAQPLGGNLHIDAEGNLHNLLPEQSKDKDNDPNAPPPVPPPIPFDFNNPSPPPKP